MRMTVIQIVVGAVYKRLEEKKKVNWKSEEESRLPRPQYC